MVPVSQDQEIKKCDQIIVFHHNASIETDAELPQPEELLTGDILDEHGDHSAEERPDIVLGDSAVEAETPVGETIDRNGGVVGEERHVGGTQLGTLGRTQGGLGEGEGKEIRLVRRQDL